MQNIKVSIIIPVYNVADYLKRCLDSCVKQTLQEIEIIIINDCSPDPLDSEIMREYEKKFSNKVHCIWHKKNLGQGAARNIGIRSAHGEFIYCVDSDDYIDLKLCEKMYNATIAENADMAMCDMNCLGKNNFIIKNCRSNGKFNTTDLCDRVKDIKTHSPCNAIVKKSIIENNNLYFPETSGYEDAICSLWYLASKKIVRINEALYYYCIRENSTTHGGRLETYINSIRVIKYILYLDYFNNLNVTTKQKFFLYLVGWMPSWCQIVCINYADEFVKFCNNILDLFKIYKIDYNDNIYMQSEENIRSVETFRFIEQNINTLDFNLKFAAYYEYQNKVYTLNHYLA